MEYLSKGVALTVDVIVGYIYRTWKNICGLFERHEHSKRELTIADLSRHN